VLPDPEGDTDVLPPLFLRWQLLWSPGVRVSSRREAERPQQLVSSPHPSLLRWGDAPARELPANAACWLPGVLRREICEIVSAHMVVRLFIFYLW